MIVIRQNEIHNGVSFTFICISALAVTHYCAQTAKILVEPDNRVKKYYNCDDIYKLTIDLKGNNLIFASLDDLNDMKCCIRHKFKESYKKWLSLMMFEIYDEVFNKLIMICKT